MILDPFVVAQTNLSGREEDELAELSYDRALVISFTSKAQAPFWLGVLNEYSLLSQKGTEIISPFSLPM